MQRLLLPLVCAALFVAAAYGTYRLMALVNGSSGPVEVTMPEAPPGPEPPAAAPQATAPMEVLPFPPRTGVGVDVELDRELAVREGELLLSGAVEELYPVLRPIRAMDLAMPEGVPVGRLDPDVGWGVYFMLRDGTLLAEVPRPMAPEGRRLGLRVDGQGRVVGERPWFDLDARKRLDGAAWTGGERTLFATGGVLPVRTRRFEERYRGAKCDEQGLCGGTIAFSEYEKGKDKPVGGSVVILGAEDTIHVYGLVIDPIEFTPGGLRYVVRKDR
ncbi:hypothetical protein [Pseudodesulfovibrio methanolicus]|uniref:Phosphodiester glycosidase domain-containing protein n=1 Tax=Pseudodesulfovibrio methanolicus TaxID=3126690 RepID=A0ABZ2J1S6_9BACT